jgi:hypothetical protein
MSKRHCCNLTAFGRFHKRMVEVWHSRGVLPRRIMYIGSTAANQMQLISHEPRSNARTVIPISKDAPGKEMIMASLWLDSASLFQGRALGSTPGNVQRYVGSRETAW